jgi:hypothetical protein
MRKLKDSPSGMLLSRDGREVIKPVVQHTGQRSDGNRAGRRSQSRAAQGSTREARNKKTEKKKRKEKKKTRRAVAPCVNSGHDFVGALVYSSRLSKDSRLAGTHSP